MAYTTIDNPAEYFNTKLYTGTGASNSVTGVGFAPDWVWIKNRDNGGAFHRLVDTVRGATKLLYSNGTNAEDTDVDSLTSFNVDGFTVGTSGGVNQSGQNIVSWNWLASNTTTANTSGTISSTVSANTTAGFSIVSYTGTGANATVGHSLGTTPSMIIVKNRSAVEDWTIYHSALGNTKFLDFTTGASQTSSTIWNNTSPTSTLFTVGTNSKVNGNTNNMIAYCFAEVKGYSKFGSYTGNNSNDGTFIYTGFKPAFILVKTTNTTQWWTLLDNKRDTYNVATLGISPNSSNSESTFNTDRGPHNIDFVSNGFKLRTDNSGINGTNSFIYMAFAENPFVSSTGIPTTAR